MTLPCARITDADRVHKRNAVMLDALSEWQRLFTLRIVSTASKSSSQLPAETIGKKKKSCWMGGTEAEGVE